MDYLSAKKTSVIFSFYYILIFKEINAIQQIK